MVFHAEAGSRSAELFGLLGSLTASGDDGRGLPADAPDRSGYRSSES